jgi:hypothetical protein
MAHLILKIVGACAIASILGPPFAQITIVATSFVTAAYAQAETMPNGSIKRRDGAAPLSRNEPNDCLPGEMPRSPGGTCPRKDSRDAIADQPGTIALPASLSPT